MHVLRNQQLEVDLSQLSYLQHFLFVNILFLDPKVIHPVSDLLLIVCTFCKIFTQKAISFLKSNITILCGKSAKLFPYKGTGKRLENCGCREPEGSE